MHLNCTLGFIEVHFKHSKKVALNTVLYVTENTHAIWTHSQYQCFGVMDLKTKDWWVTKYTLKKWFILKKIIIGYDLSLAGISKMSRATFSKTSFEKIYKDIYSSYLEYYNFQQFLFYNFLTYGSFWEPLNRLVTFFFLPLFLSFNYNAFHKCWHPPLFTHHKLGRKPGTNNQCFYIILQDYLFLISVE